MIIGYFGNLGSGKTIAVVKTLHEHWGKGYTVYTNIGVSFPYYYLTLDFLYDIVENGRPIPPKSIFALDEITLYLDSRSSAGSKSNRILSYFLLQTRKLSEGDAGLIFLYTTQFPRLIDLRLWLVTSIKIVCDCNDYMNLKIVHLRWIVEKIEGVSVSDTFFIANDYYKYYDTKQIIKMPRGRYDTKTY